VIEKLEIATAEGIRPLAGAGRPELLDRLLPGDGAWELELGFGKGRFLLARAAARPERQFVGVEVAREYFRLVAGRLARRRLPNLLLLNGEALALLATVLPGRFAAAIHVYFPDPWPKSRHQRRRLFSPASVDLVLGALAPEGVLAFATDHLDYGAEVRRILGGYPGVAVAELAAWPEGPRTNYEAKYVAAGRPIVRLEARVVATGRPHPAGEAAVAAAYRSGGPGAAATGE
jgi:tRNA (guanine-N7-)-methyltransferase